MMSKSQASATTLSGPERLTQNERTACRVIDGKAVVITIDRNQVHVLNSVGTRVWELCDGRPIDAIIDAIVAEFEVDGERARLDVCGFAAQLVALGAARLSVDTSGGTPGQAAT
jgi:hypothetical protein